jgi:hypothetical protein
VGQIPITTSELAINSGKIGVPVGGSDVSVAGMAAIGTAGMSQVLLGGGVLGADRQGEDDGKEGDSKRRQFRYSPDCNVR